MFIGILRTLVKVLLIFSILIIAFGLAFYITTFSNIYPGEGYEDFYTVG